jgi:hypothetical protein
MVTNAETMSSLTPAKPSPPIPKLSPHHPGRFGASSSRLSHPRSAHRSRSPAPQPEKRDLLETRPRKGSLTQSLMNCNGISIIQFGWSSL